MADQVLRSSIEELLLRAAKEPTSLLTVLQETEKLYETELVPTQPQEKKRRKRDVRTIRRRRREYCAKARALGILKPEQETLRRDFHRLRNEVHRRGRKDARATSKANWEWEISLDEWMMMWLSCPMVEVGRNVKKMAWKARGRKKGSVQLKRLDFNKPWKINNLQIIRGREVLWQEA